MYIEKINGPEDVKKIEVSELPKLAEEMRHAGGTCFGNQRGIV